MVRTHGHVFWPCVHHQPQLQAHYGVAPISHAANDQHVSSQISQQLPAGRSCSGSAFMRSLSGLCPFPHSPNYVGVVLSLSSLLALARGLLGLAFTHTALLGLAGPDSRGRQAPESLDIDAGVVQDAKRMKLTRVPRNEAWG
eukprot:365634-Chlamydomonas_euryale.AAC.15